MLIIEIIHQAKKKNLCNFIDDIYIYICGETIDDFFGSNICV